jgi:hypothetical protein
MDVSDPYLLRLAERWPPPTTRYHTGALIGFGAIELQLGLRLPPAYKELVHTYGNGIWLETIYLVSPFFAYMEDLEPWFCGTHGRGALTWCNNLRDERERFPRDYLYPVYPEPGGLFPYAWCYGMRGTLYWLTAGAPENWITLYDRGGLPQADWEAFEMSTTDLLWRLACADKTIAETELGRIVSPFRSLVFQEMR